MNRADHGTRAGLVASSNFMRVDRRFIQACHETPPLPRVYIWTAAFHHSSLSRLLSASKTHVAPPTVSRYSSSSPRENPSLTQLASEVPRQLEPHSMVSQSLSWTTGDALAE